MEFSLQSCGWGKKGFSPLQATLLNNVYTQKCASYVLIIAERCIFMKLQVNDGGKAFQTETSLDPDAGRGLYNVSYIYETNRCTHTHTQVERVEPATNSQTCLFDTFQNGSFHSRCLRTRLREGREVFPNRDASSVRQPAQKWNTATRSGVCSSKGRLCLIHHTFKRTAVR